MQDKKNIHVKNGSLLQILLIATMWLFAPYKYSYLLTYLLALDGNHIIFIVLFCLSFFLV